MSARKKPAERARVLAEAVAIYGGRHRADLISDSDPGGRPVQHLRMRDQWPLDRMRANRTIDDGAYAAGTRFRDAFDRASLHGVAAMDPGKPVVDGGGALWEGMADNTVGAREQVRRAMRACGPLGGDIAWHVLGMGETVADWVMRQRGAGSLMDKDRAIGVLLAALSSLVEHYGIDRPARARASE